MATTTKKNRSIRIETLDKTTLKSIFESGSGRFVEKHGEKLVGELNFSWWTNYHLRTVILRSMTRFGKQVIEANLMFKIKFTISFIISGLLIYNIGSIRCYSRYKIISILRTNLWFLRPKSNILVNVRCVSF